MRTAVKGALLATGALMAMVNVPAVAEEAAPGSAEAATQTLVFNKGDGPTTGRVIWTLGNRKEDWRAGSGNGGNWNNECKVNEGHLPNGRYGIIEWKDRNGGQFVHGRAIYLTNKACVDGTMRRGLFVHTEQKEDNTQGGVNDDEGTRWDGEGDYKSEGCVKMKPDDLAALYKISAQAGPRPTVMTVVS